jgi:hypothetical protein
MTFASSWMILPIVFVFDIEEFICHQSVPDESENSSSKNTDPLHVNQKAKRQYPRKMLELFLLNFSNMLKPCFRIDPHR